MQSTNSCCPPSSWGVATSDLDLSSYQPKGKDEIIGEDSGLSIYYTNPELVRGNNGNNVDTDSQSFSKAIIVFTDVNGVTTRLKAICDKLAEHGYHVIMPDCHRGDTASKNPKIRAWLQKYTSDIVFKDIQASIQYLGKKGMVEKDKASIGAIGFCWGAWAIAKSNEEGMKWKCAVSPHPSMKIESFVFGRDEESMISLIQMPFLLLPAGDDPVNLKPGSKIVEEIEKYGGKSVLFERMNHGWVTRGDTDNPEVKENGEKALVLAVDFFKQHM